MPPLGTAGLAHQGQWRTLLEDPARLARDYPSLAPILAEPASRRRMLKLMAASLALGGLAGCDPASTDTDYIPAVIAAPDIVPGRTNVYRSASLAAGDVIGIDVVHQMGRPIKVEGNPHHPASLGATDAFAQAMILDFYDPDRAGGVLQGGAPSGPAALARMLAGLRERLAANHGAGLRVLTGSVRSPSLAAAIGTVLQHYPAARWHQWDAVSRDATRLGTAAAYGAPVEIVPLVDQATVVLGLDSDLISSAPGHVRHARDLAARRNPLRGAGARLGMSRIYAVEPTPGLLGAIADHRYAAGMDALPAIVGGLADAVLRGQTPGSAAPPWVAAIAADLLAAQGAALVHAGPDVPAGLQALVHAINEGLGARGRTLQVIQATEQRPVDQAADMRALLADMQAGRVDTLVILDGNPAYAVPGFAAALSRVRLSLHMAPAPDETAHAATWFVPRAHTFETWDDARAYDGTATILQPMALPLYGGRSPLELLALLTGPVAAAPQTQVRAGWPTLTNDAAWHDALAAGLVPASAYPPASAKLLALPVAAPAPAANPSASGPELLLRPDPHVWDGSFANNGWLQELPRPLTKLIWDNPLLIAPQLAAAYRLANGDEVELSRGDATVRMPVWIVPGQAPHTLVALLGFGRRIVGAVGEGAGFDVTALRHATGRVLLVRTGRHETLACTDHHDPLAVRPDSIDPIVHHMTLAALQADPQAPRRAEAAIPQDALYRREPSAPVQWGMSVDLNACIGCNACVVACQAENNVPVVGKQQVIRQREMHWLRIDRYYEGPAEDPHILLQPMLCQHCEQAPCEVVCPVGATVHDDEGLNTMVYNRCIGTRFCSNNCPYKVRRFNYLAYVQREQRPAVARNPDVSARSRGVMEKCTFCVQRIAEARIAHDRDGTPEVVQTACQAACPTQAFSFGDLNAPGAEVGQRRHSPIAYAVLADHGTRPRVTYEAKIANLNPDASAQAHPASGGPGKPL